MSVGDTKAGEMPDHMTFMSAGDHRKQKLWIDLPDMPKGSAVEIVEASEDWLHIRISAPPAAATPPAPKPVHPSHAIRHNSLGLGAGLGPPYCAACGADLFERGGLDKPCTNPGAL